MASQPVVAIFFQKHPAPELGGATKPFKPGGYRDSGADTAFTLRAQGVQVVTPVAEPDPAVDADWVFGDDDEGIRAAYARGARVFWANTVLHAAHPFASIQLPDVAIVGQTPSSVQKYDDKLVTNHELMEEGLHVALSSLIFDPSRPSITPLTFPCVLKPVRGRGSQGVVVLRTLAQLGSVLAEYLNDNRYGTRFMVEEWLGGEEITIAVLPPGPYLIDGREVTRAQHWALPPMRRFNHVAGIAPCSGAVAVTSNSQALDAAVVQSPAIVRAIRECEEAARLVGARAPVRVDCRQDQEGIYRLFDFNLKPNLTGAGRPGRDDQDSLVAMAARAMGWSYGELLVNVLRQAWPSGL